MSPAVKTPGAPPRALTHTPESSLAGTVIDGASGKPVEGARVMLGDWSEAETTFSDATGLVNWQRTVKSDNEIAFMQRAGRFSTPALNMPNLWYYMPAIAGMALTTLVALDRVIGIFTGRVARPDESRPC